MNRFKRISVLVLGYLCLTSPSCQKTDLAEDPASRPDSEQQTAVAVTDIKSITGLVPQNLSICSYKLVPLCAGQYINAGSVFIQTGSDGRTYITYALTGEWAFKEIHLYAGPLSGLIVNGKG